MTHFSSKNYIFGVLPLDCNFSTWIRWKQPCRAICNSPSCVRTGCTVFEWVRRASVKWGSYCAGDGCSTVLKNRRKRGTILPCFAHLLWKWSPHMLLLLRTGITLINSMEEKKSLVSGTDMRRERQLSCSTGHCFLHVWSPSSDLRAVCFVLRHRWTKMS